MVARKFSGTAGNLSEPGLNRTPKETVTRESAANRSGCTGRKNLECNTLLVRYICERDTVTSKRTTTIPNEIRQALAIAPGTVLEWKVEGETITARKRHGVLNELQKHIQSRAGSWTGGFRAKNY